MKRIVLIVILSIISNHIANAETFYYKYLYTLTSDGMKTCKKHSDYVFNQQEPPVLIVFSDDYRLVTFGKGEFKPFVWKLAYTGSKNNVHYFDKLVVPGLRPGQPQTISTANLAGTAASEMTQLEIWCVQQPGNIRFSQGLLPVYDVVPKSPITILVKSDYSKINIYFHKSGDTVVLERSNNSKENLPDLIE